MDHRDLRFFSSRSRPSSLSLSLFLLTVKDDFFLNTRKVDLQAKPSKNSFPQSFALPSRAFYSNALRIIKMKSTFLEVSTYLWKEKRNAKIHSRINITAFISWQLDKIITSPTRVQGLESTILMRFFNVASRIFAMASPHISTDGLLIRVLNTSALRIIEPWRYGKGNPITVQEYDVPDTFA